jgi:hypothetical protein
MPRPKVPNSARSTLEPKKLNSFLHHLGRTGSVTFAAARSGLHRTQLYKHRDRNAAFRRKWEAALNLGIDRLQDDAIRRALHGTERAVFREGKQVGAIRQYDNRLLQFLLRSHRPSIYAAPPQSAPDGVSPAELRMHMKAAEERMRKHREWKAREEEKERRKAAAREKKKAA